MGLEENKNVIRQWIDARNTHALDAALKLWDETRHKMLTNGFNTMTQAFPDLHISIEDILAEGDKVVLYWTLRGTHQGLYLGIPGTQKQVTQVGIDIYTIKNGKILGTVRQSDNLGLLKQIGVTVSWEGEIIN